MADVKWIKLSTDLFNNRKIRQLQQMPDGDAMIVIWLQLLILAGTTNASGLVYFARDIPYTDQMLATSFGRPLLTIQMALQVFQRFDMIEIVDDIISISNWEKYQSAGRMEEIRQYNKLAKQRQRARQQQLQAPEGAVLDKSLTCQGQVNENVLDMSMTCQRCQDPDKDKDKDKENRNNNRGMRFTPPTLEEVIAYCKERGGLVDPYRWYDHYISNGWKVGKAPMRDWKAAVRTWERSEYNAKPQKVGPNGVRISDHTDDTLDGIL